MQEMERVSTTITSRVASDAQIMAHLETNHPELWIAIERPPDFASELYEHATDMAGWSTIGKSAAASSKWAFWRDALISSTSDNLTTR